MRGGAERETKEQKGAGGETPVVIGGDSVSRTKRDVRGKLRYDAIPNTTAGRRSRDEGLDDGE